MPKTAAQSSKGFSLSADAIKWIAILAMLIDHLAWAYLPFDPVMTPGAQLMHFIGRLTAPLMSFFIVEGYLHTRSKARYLLRLAAFAALSQPAYYWFQAAAGMDASWLYFNIFYTLSLGLLAVWLTDSVNQMLQKLRSEDASKGAAPKMGTRLMLLIFYVSGLFMILLLSNLGDWGPILILFCLLFYRSHGSEKKRLLFISGFTALLLAPFLLRELSAFFSSSPVSPVPPYRYLAGIVLCLVPLHFYNGQRSPKNWMKWFFYIFYPLHLLLIAAAKTYL